MRNGAVLAAVLVAIYALLGSLVLPLIAKPKLEAQLTQQFGRRASLERLEFNPFTFRARLSDFALTDRDSQRPFFWMRSRISPAASAGPQAFRLSSSGKLP